MRYIASSFLVLCLAATAVVVTGGEGQGAFSPYVDGDGNITIPEDYRGWAFLGSWYVAPPAGVADAAGAAGFHNVYTQRSSVRAYQETGVFPDGAVIVKELLGTRRGDMTTGDVSWATEVEGWFVMVKDTQRRFPNSPLWGNGWGWVLFNADDPETTVTNHWRTDCLGCHAPAEPTDWVFVDGYPVLHDAPDQ